MKIAIDCHTLEIENWAGKEQYLNSIIQELRKKDKSNKYFLYFRNSVFSKEYFFGKWKVRCFNLPTPLWQIFVLADMIFKGIDIVFCPCAYLLPALNIFKKQIIVIYDLTTFLPETRETHKLMTRFKEKMFLKLAAFNSKKIIAISNNTKRDIINLLVAKEEKIKVIYPGANKKHKVIDLFDAKQEIIKKRYDLPSNFILSLGTLEPRKNIVRLIESYRDLINSGLTKYKLIIVGKKGWYYEEIFNKVKEYSLEKDVIFTGYIPDEDIPALYNLATCFIYLSLYEGFGLPPLEAMSCGCPVITSNISSLPEVVGEAAILVNPRNVHEITSALQQMLLNSSVREDIRQEGWQQAKKFTWDKAVDQMLDLFTKINLKNN